VSEFSDYFSPICDILDEARAGRMFIIVDDIERENEGDLVLPAQAVSPDAINFMAVYGRGLICLALTSKRVSELRIPMMRFIISHITPAGSSPARRAISTAASVCPDLSKTPPSLAHTGNTCPGILKSCAELFGSIATKIVCARSCADIPVVTPFAASIEYVKAVLEYS
jgi:hypothetical protein